MIHPHTESSLADLLLILRRNIHENIKKEGFKHDLTFAQIEALVFIGPNKKETMKNIAEYLKITPPSATEVIAEMEKKGLVKRRRDKKDRRVVFIILSPAAKKLYASIYKHKGLILKKMLSRLNKKDYESLERIIRILISE